MLSGAGVPAACWRACVLAAFIRDNARRPYGEGSGRTFPTVPLAGLAQRSGTFFLFDDDLE